MKSKRMLADSIYTYIQFFCVDIYMDQIALNVQ